MTDFVKVKSHEQLFLQHLISALQDEEYLVWDSYFETASWRHIQKVYKIRRVEVLRIAMHSFRNYPESLHNSDLENLLYCAVRCNSVGFARFLLDFCGDSIDLTKKFHSFSNEYSGLILDVALTFHFRDHRIPFELMQLLIDKGAPVTTIFETLFYLQFVGCYDIGLSNYSLSLLKFREVTQFFLDNGIRTTHDIRGTPVYLLDFFLHFVETTCQDALDFIVDVVHLLLLYGFNPHRVVRSTGETWAEVVIESDEERTEFGLQRRFDFLLEHVN